MISNKIPKWANILIIILMIIIGSLPFTLMIIFAMLDTSSKFEVLKDGTVSIDKNKITILNNVKGTYDDKDDCYYVEGTVKNNTKDVKRIDLTYNIYDKNSIIIGTASAYLENLDSKGKWKFKADYCDYAKEATKFKLVSASTY